MISRDKGAFKTGNVGGIGIGGKKFEEDKDCRLMKELPEPSDDDDDDDDDDDEDEPLNNIAASSSARISTFSIFGEFCGVKKRKTDPL
jgi:hypothetical protein